MYFTTALVVALAGASYAAPSENKPRQQQVSASDPNFLSLIPEFGVQAGVNPTGTGNCDGFNAIANKVVPIQCDKCPPPRDDFVNKLASDLTAGNVFGSPVTFNTDPSVQDEQTNKDRATACLITLQSFYGQKGVGCPAVAAPNFAKQQVTGVRDDQQFIPQGASASGSASAASASQAARKRRDF